MVGRVDLGVVHKLEIAFTIASALGLSAPPAALGRDLFKLATEGRGPDTGDYRETLYLAHLAKRHEIQD